MRAAGSSGRGCPALEGGPVRGPGPGRSLGWAQGRWVGHPHPQKTLTHLEGPAGSLEDSAAADPLTR